MASVSASSLTLRCSVVVPTRCSKVTVVSTAFQTNHKRPVAASGNLINMVSVPRMGNRFSSLRQSGRCSAKPETVDKVCGIVKKQLALPDDTALTPESKFSDLGADSLDTVEIVMGIEEEFGINVEEENSQSIATVLDAANLIDSLVENKA